MQRVSARHLMVVVLLFAVIVGVNSAFGHCEIPCGIYNDEMRFDMISENVTTVEKSIKMIAELSKEEQPNYNQLIRWINNKENHAGEIQHIVSQYFMTQRVKPVREEDPAYKAYVMQMTLLHQMLIIAMKMKQTTDLTSVDKLRSLLREFKTVYLSRRK